jgi:hypothetical protein
MGPVGCWAARVWSVFEFGQSVRREILAIGREASEELIELRDTGRIIFVLFIKSEELRV